MRFNVLILFCVFSAKVDGETICESGYCCCNYDNGDNGNVTVQCALNIKALNSNLPLPNDTLSLDLSEGNLTNLRPSELLRSNTVEKLLLNYNKLSDIHPKSLQLPELKKLDLSDNELEFLDARVFDQIQKLEYLNLGNNNFNEISGIDFHPLVNLREIILDNNNIGRYLQNFSLFGPKCSLTTNIQSISLNNINIGNLREDYFLPARNLSKLTLSGNNLTKIPYLNGLSYLDLSDNPIEVLEFNQTFPPNITVLKINNLKIKEIAMNGLLGTFNEIQMEGNKYLGNFSQFAFGSTILRSDNDFTTSKLSMKGSNMSTLDERLLVLFTNLDVLDLQDNPWNCDCRIAWFLKLKIPPAYNKDLKCATPSYYKDKRIFDLKPDDFECGQQTLPKHKGYSEGVYELAITLGLVLYSLLLIVTLVWIYVFIYVPKTLNRNQYIEI